MGIVCRNSPELRRLLVDKARERRAKTSKLDLVFGGPEPPLREQFWFLLSDAFNTEPLQ